MTESRTVRRTFTLTVAAAVIAVACTGTDQNHDPEQTAEYRSAHGYVVDSILPMDEELRRFRGDTTPPEVALSDGATSPITLARELISAAAVGDTARLRRLHITRQEFAWSYFPTSEFSAPPYELPPALVWYRLTGESDRGITKLMQMLTNTEVVVDSVSCRSAPKVQGDNRIFEGCLTHYRAGGIADSAQLFGALIQRGERIKLLSFGNGL